MGKLLLVSMCLMATALSSPARLRRQYPSYNQQRPQNQQPYNTPRLFQRPSAPPGHRNGLEVTSYVFRYDVDAPEYGTKFGHEEQRQGDVSRGEYHVLLPDGRTQIVEYTVDLDGYHPTISYQGGGFTQGGFRGDGRY